MKELRSIGVQPDFIVCRSDHEITDSVREKIALFCDVAVEDVLACTDAPSIYEVPFGLYDQHFDERVLDKLGLERRTADLTAMRTFLDDAARCTEQVDIAVVGKYVSLPDAYLSVVEALKAAGVHSGCHVAVHLIDGETLDASNASQVLGAMDGVLVPGGFGQRAFEGKICAVRYAREQGVPFLGICLGLQAAVCEFARDVAGIEGATSAEFDLQGDGGHARVGGVRRAGHLRAPSPSFRGEQRLPRSPRGGGPRHLGRLARRPSHRDDRAS